MFCSNCGYEVTPDMKFCPGCGKKINQEKKTSEIKEKSFNWGIGKSNDDCISEVNTWLKDKRILISNIKTQGRLNVLKTKTVLIHLHFKYTEAENGHMYQMGYFSKYKWIGSDFSILDKQLETWKNENPDKQVVLSTRNGFQYDGGNTMTLYYVYTTS